MSGQANERTQVVLLSTSTGSFKYSLQLPIQRPIDQSGLPKSWLDQSRLKSGEKRNVRSGMKVWPCRVLFSDTS